MKFRSLDRLVSLVVIVTFFCSNLTGYAPSAWAQPGPSIQLPAAALALPEELGRIEDYHSAGSDKTIYLIQDAHDSLEAQEHIAQIIDFLVDRRNVRTVFEEGFEGPVPTDEYFGPIEDAALRQKVSYFFLDKLRIGGAEYAHINRKQNFELIGADNVKLHAQNNAWYRRTAEARGSIERDLDSVSKRLRELAEHAFPKVFRKWLKQKKRFRAGGHDFLDYVKRSAALYQTSETGDASEWRTQFPALAFLLNLQSKDAASAGEVRPDTGAVWREIAALEDAVTGHFLQTDYQKKLYAYLEAAEFIGRLYRIELTASEYERLRLEIQPRMTEQIAQFIYAQTGRPVILSKRWEEHIQNAIGFYETARARDEAVRARINEFLERGGAKSAALVFGGFHTGRIEEMLASLGISYYVLSPRISDLSEKHRAYYKKLMSEGRYDFEAGITATASRPGPLLMLPSAREEIRRVTEAVRQFPSHEGAVLDRSVLRYLREHSETDTADASQARPELRSTDEPMPQQQRTPLSIEALQLPFEPFGTGKTVLITGGAGYIGSFTVRIMRKLGYRVVVYDDLSQGNPFALKDERDVLFVKGKLSDKNHLRTTMRRYGVESVIHFAAFTSVPESVHSPALYYENNVANTSILLDAMEEAGVRKLVFSSSAATYGNPEEIPIEEGDPKHPTCAYGWSKLFMEMMMKEAGARGLKAIALRYFNAAGGSLEVGEDHTPEGHIIPVFAKRILKDQGIQIFGGPGHDPYETEDGTVRRDYIHNIDLAIYHALSERFLDDKEDGFFDAFNLGSGTSYSNREIADTVVRIVEELTGTKYDRSKIKIAGRRQGDPAVLQPSIEKVKQALGYEPQFSKLDTIVESAVRWHMEHAAGYPKSIFEVVSAILTRAPNFILGIRYAASYLWDRAVRWFRAKFPPKEDEKIGAEAKRNLKLMRGVVSYFKNNPKFSEKFKLRLFGQFYEDEQHKYVASSAWQERLKRTYGENFHIYATGSDVLVGRRGWETVTVSIHELDPEGALVLFELQHAIESLHSSHRGRRRSEMRPVDIGRFDAARFGAEISEFLAGSAPSDRIHFLGHPENAEQFRVWQKFGFSETQDAFALSNALNRAIIETAPNITIDQERQEISIYFKRPVELFGKTRLQVTLIPRTTFSDIPSGKLSLSHWHVDGGNRSWINALRAVIRDGDLRIVQAEHRLKDADAKMQLLLEAVPDQADEYLERVISEDEALALELKEETAREVRPAVPVVSSVPKTPEEEYFEWRSQLGLWVRHIMERLPFREHGRWTTVDLQAPDFGSEAPARLFVRSSETNIEIEAEFSALASYETVRHELAEALKRYLDEQEAQAAARQMRMRTMGRRALLGFFALSAMGITGLGLKIWFDQREAAGTKEEKPKGPVSQFDPSYVKPLNVRLRAPWDALDVDTDASAAQMNIVKETFRSGLLETMKSREVRSLPEPNAYSFLAGAMDRAVVGHPVEINGKLLQEPLEILALYDEGQEEDVRFVPVIEWTLILRLSGPLQIQSRQRIFRAARYALTPSEVGHERAGQLHRLRMTHLRNMAIISFSLLPEAERRPWMSRVTASDTWMKLSKLLEDFMAAHPELQKAARQTVTDQYILDPERREWMRHYVLFETQPYYETRMEELLAVLELIAPGENLADGIPLDERIETYVRKQSEYLRPVVRNYLLEIKTFFDLDESSSERFVYRSINTGRLRRFALLETYRHGYKVPALGMTPFHLAVALGQNKMEPDPAPSRHLMRNYDWTSVSAFQKFEWLHQLPGELQKFEDALPHQNWFNRRADFVESENTYIQIQFSGPGSDFRSIYGAGFNNPRLQSLFEEKIAELAQKAGPLASDVEAFREATKGSWYVGFGIALENGFPERPVLIRFDEQTRRPAVVVVDLPRFLASSTEEQLESIQVQAVLIRSQSRNEGRQPSGASGLLAFRNSHFRAELRMPLKDLIKGRLEGENVNFPIISAGAVAEHFNEWKRAVDPAFAGYTGLEVEADGAKQIEVMRWLAGELDMKIIYPFMNLNIEPQAVATANGYGNVIKETGSATETGIASFISLFRGFDLVPENERPRPEELKVPDPLADPMMRTQIQMIQRAKQDPDLKNRRIVAWVQGPLSLLGQMIGAENMAVLSAEEPEYFERMLDYAVRVSMAFAKAQEAAGADVITILEPSTILLRPADFAAFVVPRVNQLIQAVSIPSVFHCCGNTSAFFSAIAKISAEGFSLDEDIALTDFAKFRRDAVLIGNYSSKTFADQLVEQIAERTRQMMASLDAWDVAGLLLPATGCEIRLLKHGMAQLKALTEGLKPERKTGPNDRAELRAAENLPTPDEIGEENYPDHQEVLRLLQDQEDPEAKTEARRWLMPLMAELEYIFWGSKRIKSAAFNRDPVTGLMAAGVIARPKEVFPDGSATQLIMEQVRMVRDQKLQDEIGFVLLFQDGLIVVWEANGNIHGYSYKFFHDVMPRDILISDSDMQIFENAWHARAAAQAQPKEATFAEQLEMMLEGPLEDRRVEVEIRDGLGQTRSGGVEAYYQWHEGVIPDAEIPEDAHVFWGDFVEAYLIGVRQDGKPVFSLQPLEVLQAREQVMQELKAGVNDRNRVFDIRVLDVVTKQAGRTRKAVGFEVEHKGVRGFVPFRMGPSQYRDWPAEPISKWREFVQGKTFPAIVVETKIRDGRGEAVFSIADGERIKRNALPADMEEALASGKKIQVRVEVKDVIKRKSDQQTIGISVLYQGRRGLVWDEELPQAPHDYVIADQPHEAEATLIGKLKDGTPLFSLYTPEQIEKRAATIEKLKRAETEYSREVFQVRVRQVITKELEFPSLEPAPYDPFDPYGTRANTVWKKQKVVVGFEVDHEGVRGFVPYGQRPDAAWGTENNDVEGWMRTTLGKEFPATIHPDDLYGPRSKKRKKWRPTFSIRKGEEEVKTRIPEELEKAKSEDAEVTVRVTEVATYGGSDFSYFSTRRSFEPSGLRVEWNNRVSGFIPMGGLAHDMRTMSYDQLHEYVGRELQVWVREIKQERWRLEVIFSMREQKGGHVFRTPRVSSLERADAARELEQAQMNKQQIEVTIVGVSKNQTGLNVEYLGNRGFIGFSQIFEGNSRVAPNVIMQSEKFKPGNPLSVFVQDIVRTTDGQIEFVKFTTRKSEMERYHAPRSRREGESHWLSRPEPERAPRKRKKPLRGGLDASQGDFFLRPELRTAATSEPAIAVVLDQTLQELRGEYAVVVDLSVFESMSAEQRAEYYALMEASAQDKHIEFYFPVESDRVLTAVYQDLAALQKSYPGLIHLPLDPARFDFNGRAVVYVSKEGIQASASAGMDDELRRRNKNYVHAHYEAKEKRPGLLTASLLLLQYDEERRRHMLDANGFFSQVPSGLMDAVEHFILSYVIIAKSA